MSQIYIQMKKILREQTSETTKSPFFPIFVYFNFEPFLNVFVGWRAIQFLFFLVGAFINKRARLLQSLVFLKKRQTRSDKIFVQFN